MMAIVRRLSLVLALVLSVGSVAHAQFAIVSSVTAGSTAGNTITTGAIDTTGANFLAICVADYGAGPGSVISDSKGNTWTPRTVRNSSTQAQAQIYYSIPTSVGSGHTFTSTGTLNYSSLAAVAASGGAAASVYDVENGATGTAVSTLATGSVTPSVNGELLIGCLSDTSTDTMTIDNGFTVVQQTPYGVGVHFGVALAYLIQGTAGAINPAFSWTTADTPAAAIATFKPGSGGAAAPKTLLLLGVGGWQ